MKIKILFTLTFCYFSIVLVYGQTVTIDYTSLVQPLAGTSASTTMSATKHGSTTELLANTIPSVTQPFAMTQWTAQTRLGEAKCIAPYYYHDKEITGFRGTHWISGGCTQDYGSVTLMPITGSLTTKPENYKAAFDHIDEIATPIYYRVQLKKYGLKVELTATKRSAFFQITADRDDSLYLLITPNSDVDQASIMVSPTTNEITGNNPAHRIYQGWGKPAGFSGYFVVETESSFRNYGVFSNTEILQEKSITHKKGLGAYIGMKVKKGEVVKVRIGTSFSSVEGARRNLNAEINTWDFNCIKNQSSNVWNKALGQIEISTADFKHKHIFYTSFYHALQHPRLYNDVDGTYPMFSKSYQLAKLDKGNYYDDFSMWDIYRAQLPLLELLQPDFINDCVNSLLLKAEQGGWLPNFPCWNSYTSAMVGDHATAFIASAYVNGIRGYNVGKAYSVMRKNAFEIPTPQDYADGKGRRSLANYLQYGYYPIEDEIVDAFHKKEQVSRTLEYAFDDACLATFAKRLGKTSDAAILAKRGRNYINVFDTTIGFANGRFTNGAWYKPLDPDKKLPVNAEGISLFTEGTSRQYSFYVPQDIDGLTKLLGGKQGLENKLDSLFVNGHYWHGNEPGHQVPFMYNYTNAPHKAQYWVHKILAEEYGEGVGGLSGNDDAGQMSAWYQLASMGFYPVNPANGLYQLTSPLFDKVLVHLPNKKTITISCYRQSSSSIYIQQILLNGKKLNGLIISHKDLAAGANLLFKLSEKPLNSK